MDDDQSLVKRGNSAPEVVQLKLLPPLLAGQQTADSKERVEKFYRSVAAMFEAWVMRRDSKHTQRTYRRSVMNFIEFMEIPWPRPEYDKDKLIKLHGLDESYRFLQCTVDNVLNWRTYMSEELDQAPATLNARLASVSTFYKYLREAAGELRLPIVVPNPAHAQFIPRPGTDPVEDTNALTATRARQLTQLPKGETPLAYRDRAILTFMIYSGVRIRTVKLLNCSDFTYDDENPTIKIQEKGRKKIRRQLGINAIAADAIKDYLEIAGITSGPLFRARKGSRTEALSTEPISESSLYRLIFSYLYKLKGATYDEKLNDGTIVSRCIYTPHSLRATTATLLFDLGEDARDIQILLGHKDISTTIGYDKRNRKTLDSASHKLTI